MKQLVAAPKGEGRSEVTAHALTERPWGWFRTLSQRPGFQVKEILVRPGAKLSLQRHKHRAEQWIVASGEALVRLGERELRLTARGYVDIAQGQIHRLTNPSDQPLHIIEVQTGDYLGEDDIERLADEYGRGGDSSVTENANNKAKGLENFETPPTNKQNSDAPMRSRSAD